MAIVEEEVLPLDAEAAPEPPKLERQKAIDWKEKVACPGCARVLRRHCLEFSHQCKGPKPEKQPRARLEPPPQVQVPQVRFEEPAPPPPTPEQYMRQILVQDKARREAISCGPMRAFYGLN